MRSRGKRLSDGRSGVAPPDDIEFSGERKRVRSNEGLGAAPRGSCGYFEVRVLFGSWTAWPRHVTAETQPFTDPELQETLTRASAPNLAASIRRNLSATSSCGGAGLRPLV